MTRLIDRPDWRACMTIIREEASKAGVDAEGVIHALRGSGPVCAARQSAIRRILQEARCSQHGLASVWGLSVATIRAALDAAPATASAPAATSEPERKARNYRGPADPGPSAMEKLYDRLRWAYGDTKAAQIIDGRDPKTQRDLAAWKALGTGRAAA